jgi:hypothetical protein
MNQIDCLSAVCTAVVNQTKIGFALTGNRKNSLQKERAEMMLTGKDTVKVEFIESYIKHGAGDYEWNDNHGELVRCKDCKHKGDSYECRFDRDLEEHGSHRTDAYDDWFCADGVKRND